LQVLAFTAHSFLGIFFRILYNNKITAHFPSSIFQYVIKYLWNIIVRIKFWQSSNWASLDCSISFTIYQFILSHNIEENRMSKNLKKENPPLKFDTSSANIGCFIRNKSKPKPAEHERTGSSFKSKKRAKH
jgi:hypothetical protein